MNIAYIDCFSGISGDMFLGALVDCGLPRKILKQELAGLSLSPYTIRFTSEQRMHISGCRIHIKTDTKTPPSPESGSNQAHYNTEPPQSTRKAVKHLCV